MRQMCKQCKGKGRVRIDVGGFFLDAVCLDCNETGYIDDSECSCGECRKMPKLDLKKRTRQLCKHCNGRGRVLTDIGGVLVDAVCLDCNETGYVEVEI